MTALRLLAERRPAQDKLVGANADEIGQVRMARRELGDLDRPREVRAFPLQEGGQPAGIELLAGTRGPDLVI